MLFNTLSHGQDWANLKRFQQENSELSYASKKARQILFQTHICGKISLSDKSSFP